MMGGWGYGGYGGYGYGWTSMLGMIIPLIIVIGIVFLVIYVFRRNVLHNNNGPFVHSNSAMDILRERYARGEIDTEEYQNRKRDLEGK